MALNYYSVEANQKFCSASQLKDFLKCEAMAVEKMNGTWSEPPSKALDLGSYVDALLTSNHEDENWIENHKDVVFQKNGKPYAEFVRAAETVCLIQKQPLMMHYLSGEHQKMMIGEIEGLPFKIRMDSYKEGEFIADLKYLRSLRSPNLFENVLSYWDYDIQCAIYVEIVRQNTGKTLPFYFVIATKEDPPHLEVVKFNDYDREQALESVKAAVPRIKAIKEGLILPERCEDYDCKYCTETRVLTEPIDNGKLGLPRRKDDTESENN